MSEKSGFYRGKKVFITGHTGFKGSYMVKTLLKMGAKVSGYSLKPYCDAPLFNLLEIEDKINNTYADICDYERLESEITGFSPDIVFHLAAQPIVRISYKEPQNTFKTNIIGTVNLLEAIRHTPSVKAAVIVTTDKVYYNDERSIPFRETDPLGGADPYSASKSCAEIVTMSYRKSFFEEKSTAVAALRAGNVIGGGDFSKDRIMPDCVRAVLQGEDIPKIVLRNPYSIRPYQHVLETVYAYMLAAKKMYEDKKYEGAYNIGPDTESYMTTLDLVRCFNENLEKKLKIEVKNSNEPRESISLKLDNTLFKKTFSWSPVWDIKEAVEKVYDWTMSYKNKENMEKFTDSQINDFFGKIEL